MARAKSAGLLAYCPDPDNSGHFRFLIGHPGGPFFRKKDAGHWTIPKGEFEEAEDPYLAACREFREETGLHLDFPGDPIALGSIRQKGGKEIVAWAVSGTFRNPQPCKSNTFPLEWPPKSGKTLQVPELDQLLWADEVTAREKLKEAQIPLLERLLSHLQRKAE